MRLTKDAHDEMERKENGPFRSDDNHKDGDRESKAGDSKQNKEEEN